MLKSVNVYIFVIKILMQITHVTNSSCERNLGVVIDESLNYNRHCAKAVLPANKIMGIINRTYSCKAKIIF